jgi:hypothetical protein
MFLGVKVSTRPPLFGIWLKLGDAPSGKYVCGRSLKTNTICEMTSMVEGAALG